MAAQIRNAEELRRRINSACIYINNLKPVSDIDKTINKIYKDTLEMKRLCSSLNYTVSNYWESELNAISTAIDTLSNELYNSATIEDIKRASNEFVEHQSLFVTTCESIRNYSLSDTGMRLNNVENDIYYLGMEKLSIISDYISPDKELNMFSPQTFDGKNESEFCALCSCTVNPHGLEQERYGFNDAKQRIDRMIKGSLKGSIISHDFFDMIFLVPKISILTELKNDGHLTDTNENILLKNSMQYLKNNGLFIYTIPFYRLTPEMLLFMSKWLRNIEIFRYEDDLDTTRFVTIMGIKDFNPSYADVFSTLCLLTYESLSTSINTIYEVETVENTELKLFRGSVLDESELDEIINNDGLYSEFFNSIEIKDNLKDSKPLLPFNIGQIGLILSSGCLDGVVDEVDGVKHVIKGMTIKQTDKNTESTINAKGETIIDATTTVSNRVQISAFGADGKFYTLV